MPVAGAPRSQDRAPEQTEPQNHALAILRPRDAHRLEQVKRRRENDKDRRRGHRSGFR